MKPGEIDLGRSVLDHQIYDRGHLECGKVDDLELSLEDGVLRVVAIRTGSGVALERLPAWLRTITGFVLGRSSSRIPWADVEIIGTRLQLRDTARDRALDRADRRASRWLRFLPGSGYEDQR